MNKLLGLLLGLSAAFWLNAETLPAAQAEYSADRIISGEMGEMRQKVFHSFGKERVEMQMEGMQTVMISRPDLGKFWNLMPMLGMYMEIDSAKAGQMSGQMPDDMTIEKMGPDQVNGIATTKYKMLMKDKSAGGFIWLTAEHIPLQMDFISKEGGEKTRVKMTMSNLTLSKQDAALFELPQGLNPMPNMNSLMGGRGN
ncbi:DUF4412 domain-containing protein [Rheinheimera sp.]|jgi:hypothetical protein|uniref:DUF4412 domain-containing protein n=1 Tax=Rheinheimera sp. TaxID=1869214 RepID=UPI00261DC557|nr:DUF4412 domain-containing protein [Rheinheimera sp.]MCA1931323.1 DUF4412 domain-containing protein [Rheinheimera sp.]